MTLARVAVASGCSMLTRKVGGNFGLRPPEAQAGSQLAGSLCAVTVTYGDRQHLVRQVLIALLRETAIQKIVVVSNGAPWNIRMLAGELAPCRIEVVELESNQGSAAGFAAGIKRACEFGADFIWLLDDDNKPEPGALAELLAAYAHLRVSYSEENLAVVALRPALEGRISRGLLPARTDARQSSFWQFHIFDVPYKIWCRMPWGRPRAVELLPPLIETAVGPYGGLLFHRAVVEKHGLPRLDFVLYRDDLEFTSRITRGGGAIRLVTSAIIFDLDESWYASRRFGNSFQAWLEKGSSNMRVFYEARNRAYMDSHCLPHNRLMYWLNRRVYCFALWMFALIFRRMDRYRLLQSAIADGLAGRLGIAPRFPLG
jgi:GT2 family glycosyltransferase